MRLMSNHWNKSTTPPNPIQNSHRSCCQRARVVPISPRNSRAASLMSDRVLFTRLCSSPVALATEAFTRSPIVSGVSFIAGLFAITSTRWVSASRSEEHTSELQSLMRISYAVFCLKKKIKQKTNNYIHKYELLSKQYSTYITH